MAKDIRVLLIEDDLYACNLMSLLLTRDWRTRVIGEAGNEETARRILEDENARIDAIIIDTEVPDDPDWPFRVAEIAWELPVPPTILCTATKPDTAKLKRLITLGFHGYVLKHEIGYALAAAVTEATKKDRWVITNGVYKLALRQRIELPSNTVVMDGTNPVTRLTPREDEVARLAILFNLAHRDLADELLIRSDQVSKYVSNVYTKLGLNEILTGEIRPEAFFEDEVVLNHFLDIFDRVARSPKKHKTSDMATLAFHLLTVPKVNETP